METLRTIGKKGYHTIRVINDYLTSKPYLRTLLIFSFFVIVFQWMYISVGPLISSDDHYFHFRFAQLMTERGFFPMFNNFKNVYFSPMTQGQYYPTYNFLFYLAIIPLTYLNPLFLAIKLYAVLAGALAFTLFYICCRWYGIKQSFFWTIVLISLMGINSFFHLFLSRPYVLAPVLLLVILLAAKNRKYWLIFILTFIYFFWHNVTFWFPLMTVVGYFVFEKFYNVKTNLKIVGMCSGGIVVAIVMTALFAHGFIEFQLISISSVFLSTLSHTSVTLPEGGELYPVDFFQYITSNALIFAAFIVAVCYEIAEYIHFRKNLSDTDTRSKTDSRQPLRMTVFFISLIFFFGTIEISGRFNDYFIFFAGFYIVMALDALFRNVKFLTLRTYRATIIGIIIVIVSLFANNILLLQQTIATTGSPVEVFAGVGNWLKNNTQKGDIIFNPDWSWFPQLYYYSPDNYYIAGMEPRVFYDYNQKLFWEWINIGERGYPCEKESCPELEEMARTSILHGTTTATMWYKTDGDEIAQVMLHDFKSSYIIGSQTQTARLNDVLDNNKHFKKVYGAGKAYFIYKVIP